MGQKVNPIGFRISVDKNWRSRWFADKRAFGDLLDEDLDPAHAAFVGIWILDDEGAAFILADDFRESMAETEA